VGTLLLAALLLLALGAWSLLRLSLPERSGRTSVAGLEAPVEIRFDDRARPFVQARTMEDALFAQGWLHASERLFQMELFRRAGSGRMAEALGPSLLDTDRALWRAGVPQLAARLQENASARTRQRVSRYVAGVNAALAALAVRPPALLLAGIEVAPWRTGDVFALAAVMAFDSGRNRETELLRWTLAQRLSPAELAAFVPDGSPVPDFPYMVDPDRALGALRAQDALSPAVRPWLTSPSLGSNGWAVSPARSASGRALFAFDSHDALALPNLQYEVHLFFGDGAQLRGWSVPGLPAVINGFNERMAWGFTNIGDSQDLFLEERHPDDPLRLRSGDGWVRGRVEVVEIPVRGREAPERLEVVHGPHGPLIQDDPPLALAWAAHHVGDRGLDALFDLGRARSWEEASAALDRFPAPSANLTYADVSGRVAVRSVGLLPVRGRGEGLLPLDGRDPANAWQGFVPMAELPRQVDPPLGFVAAANARVTPPGDRPLVSAENAPGYRMTRIVRVLAGDHGHRPADMQALQLDWHNGQAERVLPSLVAGIDPARLDDTGRRAAEALQRWARRPENEPDSAGALVFEALYLRLADELFAERLGPELHDELLRRNYVLNHALDGLLLAEGPSPWWRGDRAARIHAAFVAAVADLATVHGADPEGWRWDAVQAVHLQHELGKAVSWLDPWLGRGPFPWGGGPATVGRASYPYLRPNFVNRGATMRVVIELSDPMRALAIVPGGQAGHPLDPHYDDQIDAWLAGRLEALPARFEEVRGTSLRLVPASP